MESSAIILQSQLFDEGKISGKVDVKNGFLVSNLRTLAWQISQEEVDHRFSMTRHF